MFFSPWRWRSYELANSVYKMFSHLPTGIYQLDDVSNGSDDWAGRKYELPSGYRMHHKRHGCRRHGPFCWRRFTRCLTKRMWRHNVLNTTRAVHPEHNLSSIDSIHGQRNPHRERGLAGMGNGCFAEFCCCVPLCPCELRYSSSKDISFHRFPGDKVAGRECIFKSRRDMPLLWNICR